MIVSRLICNKLYSRTREMCMSYWSYLNTVVDVEFENSMYTVNEDIGTADFCVILTGRIERDLSLNVAAISSTAVSSGNIDQLQIHDISSSQISHFKPLCCRFCPFWFENCHISFHHTQWYHTASLYQCCYRWRHYCWSYWGVYSSTDRWWSTSSTDSWWCYSLHTRQWWWEKSANVIIGLSTYCTYPVF